MSLTTEHEICIRQVHKPLAALLKLPQVNKCQLLWQFIITIWVEIRYTTSHEYLATKIIIDVVCRHAHKIKGIPYVDI